MSCYLVTVALKSLHHRVCLYMRDFIHLAIIAAIVAVIVVLIGKCDSLATTESRTSYTGWSKKVITLF